MSKDKLTDAIGGIGDDLIAEAKERRVGIVVFRRIAAAAACLAILMGAFYLAMHKAEQTPAEPILQNSTAPTNTPTIMPSIPTTATPISSSRKPTNSRPTASTTLSFAPSTRPTTPPIVSSTTVMPSTSNDQVFTPSLVIRSEEMYEQLFLAADDVSVMIKHQDFIKSFSNQDELKAFVNKLRQLPIPQIDGAVCTLLEYIPDNQMLNITLQVYDEVAYSFTFELSAQRADEILEGFADRNMLLEQEWAVPGCETFKSVTEFKLLSTIFPGRYGCWVEINGMLASFSCNGLTGNVQAEDVFGEISIGNTIIWK